MPSLFSACWRMLNTVESVRSPYSSYSPQQAPTTTSGNPMKVLDSDLEIQNLVSFVAALGVFVQFAVRDSSSQFDPAIRT